MPTSYGNHTAGTADAQPECKDAHCVCTDLQPVCRNSVRERRSAARRQRKTGQETVDFLSEIYIHLYGAVVRAEHFGMD